MSEGPTPTTRDGWTPFAAGDRIARDGEGRLVGVDSSYAKPGWVAPVPGAYHRPGSPGTAVLFEDRWYEVRAAGAEGQRTCYELAPWDEAWPIRAPRTYDAETCAAEARAYAAARRQTRQAPLLAALAPLVGLLPAPLQLAWEERCGVPATRATAISALLLELAATPFFLGGLGARMAPGMGAAPTPFLRVAGWLFLPCAYLMAESLWRLGGAVFAATPSGTLLAVLPLAVIDALRRPPPATVPAGEDRDRARSARHATWVETFAPLGGLLDEPLQRRLEARFQYSPERATRESIWLVVAGAAPALVLAAAWLATPRGNAADVLVLLGSAGLLGESALRGAALGEGQIRGSLLGRALAPLARRLLG